MSAACSASRRRCRSGNTSNPPPRPATVAAYSNTTGFSSRQSGSSRAKATKVLVEPHAGHGIPVAHRRGHRATDARRSSREDLAAKKPAAKGVSPSTISRTADSRKLRVSADTEADGAETPIPAP